MKNVRKKLLRTINIWPPMLGDGIRVTRISPDMRAIDVEMKIRWWNANYVGTAFGGSLYTMADPFYMLMLIENLGPEYIVWDKAATIRFRKPGKGKLRVQFRLSEEEIADIRRQADTLDRYEPTFRCQITDETGEVVAEVEKLLYVRRKAAKGAQTAAVQG